MQNIEEKIKELEEQLSELTKQQNFLNLNLYKLSEQLNSLKRLLAEEQKTLPPIEEKTLPPAEEKIDVTPSQQTTPLQPAVKEITPLQTIQQSNKPSVSSNLSSKGFEEFIGRNIASKVGILVTIIGVFIGAKYAIDKNLISPSVRIVLGYIAGAALITVALRLKKKYENYSAVLMGGGLAVLYFITYIAFSFYQLLPQSLAFGIMLAVTAATVYAAIVYDKVIIAHIGFIGAYSIPYLLSNNSWQYAIFFSYIAIINTGILVVSFLRYWKSLFYTSFFLTWFIYAAWSAFQYNKAEWNTVAWIFLCIFFVQFYACFLAYKLIKKEKYGTADTAILLLNSFIFYGSGYALLEDSSDKNLEGAFTLLNAAIHFCIALLIKYFKQADKAMLFVIGGLVMAFITIAIPVQFDGNWVTLLWAAQSVVLLYAGRTQQRAAYEKLAIIVSLLTIFSQLLDWVDYTSYADTSITSFANIHFFSAIIVCLLFGVIIWLHHNKKFVSALRSGSLGLKYLQYGMPVVLIVFSYITGFIEIDVWGNKMHSITNLDVWLNYNQIILLCYSLVFIYALCAINFYFLKNEWLAKLASAAMLFVFFLCLTNGLTVLGSLRDTYLHEKQSTVDYFAYHYLLFALLIAGLAIFNYWLLPYWKNKTVNQIFTLSAHAVILTLVSNEYIHWMDISFTSANQYKLGLSIVWGVYALMLIVLGIWKKRKYLRLGAIVLFGVTLIKLFFYDIAGLSTITKTVSFISLGVTLLIVSYLYNRYKHVILADDE